MNKKDIKILLKLDKARHNYATEVITRCGIRRWEKFHKHNKLNRSDCQLVTVLNAYYYLYGKTIGQNTKTYERLTDLCCCRNGAAIGIEKIYEHYKINTIKYGK